jgi:hypothetical protein
MSTEWFDRSPGDVASPNVDDPSMLIVGAGSPDWVVLPAQLGGERRRVTRSFVDACPCGGHDVRHLHAGDVGVAECRQFLWYRVK